MIFTFPVLIIMTIGLEFEKLFLSQRSLPPPTRYVFKPPKLKSSTRGNSTGTSTV